MKRAIKSVASKVANWLDTPAVILLYHRVTELKLDPQQLAVSPKNFSAHLDILKKKYNLLDIGAFLDLRLRGKKVPERSVVISFDDGYADNFHEAMPILEEKKAQAIFYVATAHLDTSNEFWWDNLERIFLVEGELPASLTFSVGQQRYHFDTSSPEKKVNTYHALHPIIKNCAVALREEAMTGLLQWSGLSREGRKSHRHMTADELIRLSKSSSVVIGAHTHNHPKLSACTAVDQRDEIQKSKRILESITGQSVKHFSYPFGTKTDYNAASISICKSLGFDLVSANNHGTVHRWQSNFELPRALVRNWDGHTFEKQVEDFFLV